MMGIDEAGRGSVLGPMIYGAAYWPVAMNDELSKRGFDDSKALTEQMRTSLFEKIKKTPEVGYVVRTIQSAEISSNMFRKVPFGLLCLFLCILNAVPCANRLPLV
jgi:ribonuclease H2 subunit A